MAIKLEKSGRVGILWLQRPEAANALNRELLREMEIFQKSLRRDRSIRVLVTAGEGKGFSAGSDLREIAGMSAQEARRSQGLEARVCRNFLSLPQPTIAAVHGYALGGGLVLAAHHDFRLMAADVRLGLPEVRLGWNPTFGIQRLIQLAGISTVTRWMLLGEEFSASEAHEHHLATAVVVDAARVVRDATSLAERLAALPAAGLAAIKEALWQQTRHELKRSDRREGRLFQRCVSTADALTSLRRYMKGKGGRGRRK